MTSANADTVRDPASDTLDPLRRAAAPAINEGKRQAGALLDQSGDLIGTVSETAADLGKSLIAYTKRNPLIALALALGAGALLVGAARSRRSRR